VTNTAPRPSHVGRKGWQVVAGVLVALLVAFLVGYLPRWHARSQATAEAQLAQEPLRLAVVAAEAVDAGRDLSLPGTLVGNQRTFIYPRATGYVRRWVADIGDRVRAGDVLLELDTPDLDQQLASARATFQHTVAALAQAVANRDFALLTFTRMHILASEKLIAQQDEDQARSNELVQEATVQAAKADVQAQRELVRQLEVLVGFKRVAAPFDGIITQRLVDVGTLVNAGTGTTAVVNAAPGTTPAALYEIEATDPIRVFVEVPQPFTPMLRVGQGATLALRQFPGRLFTGRVTRTAGALDSVTRTMRTQIDISNDAGTLLAGMYGEVTMPVAIAHAAVRVPESALLRDARGIHIAVIDLSSHVHLVAVQPGRDFGAEIELVDGLTGGERVVVNPPANIADNQLIDVVNR
jgi:membrane fusion protein, multidrug efflux system